MHRTWSIRRVFVLSTFIAAYLLLTLAIGFWAARRITQTQDFTLAGRSLSGFVVGVTIFATWFGAEMIMGVPGMFVTGGVQATIVDLFGIALCLILVATFFAGKLYRLNVVTLSDFFRNRFSPAVESASAVIVVFTYFSWIAAQFLALALLFHTIFGIGVELGIVCAAAIVMTYTYVGGMWAVSITDLIQSFLIVVGLVFVALALMGQVDSLANVVADQPEGFWSVLPQERSFEGWMDYATLWMTYGVGGIAAQEIFQRVLSARSQRAGVAGTYIAALLLFTLSCLPLLIALCINAIEPTLVLDNEGQNMIPAYVAGFATAPLQVLFFGALISTILSTCSGAMLAPATVIGENLIKPYFKRITDAQLLKATRISVLFVAFVSGGMAYKSESIHGLVVDSVILLTTCIIVPLTAGLYWKGASVAGAWAAMAFGFLTWLVCMLAGTRIEPWMYGLVASAAAMVLVSMLRPDESSLHQVSAAMR